MAEGEGAAAKVFRARSSRRVDRLLEGRPMLCLPTSPILPIGRDAPLSEMRMAVRRIVDLTGIAGLAGCPQVNLPLAAIGAIPVGLSLIGWRGGGAPPIGPACPVARGLAPGGEPGETRPRQKRSRTRSL